MSWHCCPKTCEKVTGPAGLEVAGEESMALFGSFALVMGRALQLPAAPRGAPCSPSGGEASRPLPLGSAGNRGGGTAGTGGSWRWRWGGRAPGAALVPAPSPRLAPGGRRRLPAGGGSLRASSLPHKPPPGKPGGGKEGDGGGRSRAAMPPPPPRCGGPAPGLPPVLRGRSSALTPARPGAAPAASPASALGPCWNRSLVNTSRVGGGGIVGWLVVFFLR